VPKPKPKPPELRAGAPTLLLVEDHEVTRRAISKLLAGAYRILAAKDGAEALALCADLGRGVDVVVTDLGLPDMRGDELVAELRLRKLADRVIYMSGRPPDDPTVSNATADQRATFLEKPVEYELLEQALDELLAAS
jgi:CheY-like chemotaxis protein